MIRSVAGYGKLLVMPKFTTKDLLSSTALVSLGCGLLWMIFNRPEFIGGDYIFGLLFAWPCAFAIIGAGLLLPVGRPWLGAGLGLLAFTILMMLPDVQ